MKNNEFKFNYGSYISKRETENKYADAKYQTIAFDDVCKIISKNKVNSKTGLTDGKYPLYFCSIVGYKYLNTFKHIGRGIIINTTNGSGKCAIYYVDGKYNVGHSTIHFRSKDETVCNTKYIYYYLKSIHSEIQALYTGSNQKSLTQAKIKNNIRIPIYSIEDQMEIVNRCDEIYNNINETKKKIKELKNTININMDKTKTMFI